MSTYAYVNTPTLQIGYLEWNSEGARTAVLLHGWPDSPDGWTDVAECLASYGYRVLAPALRGFEPTRFRYPTTPRSGQLSALGRDLLDFIDALDLQQVALIGHDWGARAVANACGLRPGVASHLVMLSVGYGTNDPHQPINLQQARNYWYHWFMATPRGAKAVENERLLFTREMWDSWSPPGWYRQEDFNIASRAFLGSDWAKVVLHSYRHRWGLTKGDPTYDIDEKRLQPAPQLDVATLVLHGEEDLCNSPSSSSGRDHFFRGRYERLLIPTVGHFPHREAASTVAEAILRFCAL